MSSAADGMNSTVTGYFPVYSQKNNNRRRKNEPIVADSSSAILGSMDKYVDM